MAVPDGPRRVAIVGNGGGGKSTLARELARARGLPLHVIDDVQFLPGWRPAPREEVARAHAAWMRDDAWVVDGWGDWPLIEERLAMADLIVLVDFPLGVHLRWAMKRQLLGMLGLTRGWPPPGCSAWRVTWRMVRTILRVHRDLRPRLVSLVASRRPHAHVEVVRSPSELRHLRHRLHLTPS